MRYDIYAWGAPRDLSVEDAIARIDRWEADGGDPALAPFEPSSDVAGFFRELEHDMRDLPGFEVVADAERHTGRGPVWLQTDPAPPAHIAAVRLPRGPETALRAVLEDVQGIGIKFDVVVFDAVNGVIHEPMAEMSAYASATFWPGGAIRSVVAGGGGFLVALAAYLIGIPILSGVVIVVGLFMFVLSVVTLVAELRKRRADTSGRT